MSGMVLHPGSFKIKCQKSPFSFGSFITNDHSFYSVFHSLSYGENFLMISVRFKPNLALSAKRSIKPVKESIVFDCYFHFCIKNAVKMLTEF